MELFLKTWVKDHPEYVSHFKGRLIVTDDTDVNSEEVVLVGDCKVLANDSGDKGFCRRKGSKYCRVVQYVEGGQISYFAHDDLGKLMIAVRQNCLQSRPMLPAFSSAQHVSELVKLEVA